MKNILLIASLSLFTFSCGDEAANSRVDTVKELSGDTSKGKTLYESKCLTCHASDGGGTKLGPNVRKASSKSDIKAMLKGPDSMPSYEGLSDQELADIDAYVQSL